ncbi:MAG: hypothetical protein HYZ29_08525 [Myxococcales bacterium]|nr:hypothetical protein [Myxococcales bacterium]
MRHALADRLPKSIEDLHDHAHRMVAVTGGERDLAEALVARLLIMLHRLPDESVHAMLAHRLAAGVMTS